MSKVRMGIKLGPHSEETKKKISDSNKLACKTKDFSYGQDPDYRSKQSENMKRIWIERKAQKKG